MDRPLSRKAAEYRLRLLQTYLERDAQAEQVVTNTERDILALLVSKPLALRTLPSVMKDVDRLLATQEAALLSVIESGLQDIADETAARSLEAQ